MKRQQVYVSLVLMVCVIFLRSQNAQTQQCTLAAPLMNTYYVQVKAIDVESSECGTAGSIRGVNMIKKFFPDAYTSPWVRRTFQFDEHVEVWQCQWKPYQCVRSRGPWHKVLSINDYAILNYTYKFNSENGDMRIVYVLNVFKSL